MEIKGISPIYKVESAKETSRSAITISKPRFSIMNRYR